jgi:hypothetical protein
MALNFPSNPSDLDVYENYRYNATVGAWQSIRTGALVEMSETAPANPLPGQLWFNETEGKMYVSYNDGTSTQWVAAVGGYISAINTDTAEQINRLYVGTTDPDTLYTLTAGDIWIEVPS